MQKEQREQLIKAITAAIETELTTLEANQEAVIGESCIEDIMEECGVKPVDTITNIASEFSEHAQKINKSSIKGVDWYSSRLSRLFN